MKKISSISLLTAVAASGLALGAPAYTTPVGYATKVLAPNKFTLVAPTLQNPVVSAGILTAASSTSVTAGTTNFVTLLGTPNPATPTPTYILELSDGTVQEVNTWNSSGVLTTPDNISSKVTAGTTTYKLRKAATVSDLFGATNSVGLTPDTDGDYTTGNDLLLIPTGTGTFTTVYYYNDGTTSGWFDAQGNDASSKVIAYPDGFFIQRGTGSSINLTVSGEVKVAPTSGILTAGFNYLSGVVPTGVTLADSGLANSVSASSDGNYLTVDNVYLQQTNGTYKVAYYFNDGAGTSGWFDVDGNEANAEVLDGGFLILNRGSVKPYSIAVPSAFSSL